MGEEVIYKYEERLKKEAIEKGMKEGIEKGMKEGIEKSKIEIAKKLLLKNTPLKEIIELTSLSEKQINSLK